MNQEKEKQYREELNILLETDKSLHYPVDCSDNLSMLWRAYIAGRKKGDEEIEDLNFQLGCAQAVGASYGKTIDKMEKEIAQLKLRIKELECSSK